VAVLLIAAYGTRTWIRNRVWADPVTFGFQLAEDAPRNVKAHLKAAEGHLHLAGLAAGGPERLEELRRAEAELDAAAAIKEDEAFALRAALLVEYERYPEALEYVQKARESYRRERLELDPRVLYLEARVLDLLGRPNDALRAIADYQRRQRTLPAPLYHLRGKCRMGLGQLAEAKPDLDEAVRLEPENGVYRMDRGVLLAQLKKTEEARGELERAVSLSPENPQVYTNRGYLRFLTGDRAGALADYRKGLEICERLGRVTAVRGESVLAFRRKIFDLLLRSGDREGAQRELEAVRAIPGDAAAEIARGLEAQLSAR
jgi:Flp pilus assembly protein TadD